MKNLILLFTLFALPYLALAEESEAFMASTNNEGEQEITMEASSYAFSPDKIVVNAGVPVVLKIKKIGWVPHDFIIDDPDSDLAIREKLGKTTEIRFTPQNRGEFVFYCGKKLPFAKSHKDKGMHGMLIVK